MIRFAVLSVLSFALITQSPTSQARSRPNGGAPGGTSELLNCPTETWRMRMVDSRLAHTYSGDVFFNSLLLATLDGVEEGDPDRGAFLTEQIPSPRFADGDHCSSNPDSCSEQAAGRLMAGVNLVPFYCQTDSGVTTRDGTKFFKMLQKYPQISIECAPEKSHYMEGMFCGVIAAPRLSGSN